MAGLLMELDPSAEIEVVPGITACQAAAARLGAPLMNDFCVLSLSDLLTPREEVLRRVSAVAAADLVVCLYNPTSRRRRPLFEQVVGNLLQARLPETPVGWVKNAYREGEEIHLTTLGQLSEEPVDMWSVVVVGSSRTEVLAGRMVTRRGYREKYGTGESAEEESSPDGGGAQTGPETEAGAEPLLYVLGGTSFSRQLVSELEGAGYRVRLSVATPLGAAEVQEAPAGGVHEGRLDVDGLRAELESSGARALIDATHPFAVEVSRAARQAAEVAGLPLLRASRPAWAPENEEGRVTFFSNAQDAASALAESGEKAFLTVGAKGLTDFAGRGLPLAARVLPTPESVQAAGSAGIAPEDLIAAYPPYDAAFTAACLSRTRASIIVSKESGREGGLDEKLEAARLAGARLFVVGRPAETENVYHDHTELLKELEGLWIRS
jgi:precorrin-3B C17-methyltransferase